MGKFIQYSTKESLYDGPFGGTAGWAAAGMGYVFVTDEGKIIVVDGGCPNDAEDFLELLEKYADGKKPTVEFWIITHPHEDHYGAVMEMAKNNEWKSRVSVKKFLYWFPMEFCNGVVEEDVLKMENIVASFGAESVKPYRDMVCSVDEMNIHFLSVPDDCSLINSANGNKNHCSLIFTVQGSTKKAMITGDAYKRTLLVVDWRYAEELQCDYLQLPHHGLCDTGELSFYQHVNAAEVFVPISIAGDRVMHSDMYSLERTGANLWAESHAKAVHKSFEGTLEVEM